jgi:hypothetical protein
MKKSSEKSFGLVFSFVFAAAALYPLIKTGDIRLWAIIISMIFLFLAFLVPKSLILPNNLWINFGVFLGSIITPIITALIFFVTVLPTGLFIRLLGKDLLNQKLDKNAKSYWIKRSETIGSMKNQF